VGASREKVMSLEALAREAQQRVEGAQGELSQVCARVDRETERLRQLVSIKHALSVPHVNSKPPTPAERSSQARVGRSSALHLATELDLMIRRSRRELRRYRGTLNKGDGTTLRKRRTPKTCDVLQYHTVLRDTPHYLATQNYGLQYHATLKEIALFAKLILATRHNTA
ncbi:MAG: hypothetical protein SGPRY_010373, partial [Prymnesium sp.]